MCPTAAPKHRPLSASQQHKIPPPDDKEIHKFYTSTTWRRLRKIVLDEQPLCETCLKQGILTSATVVDHLTPVQVAPQLKLVRSNLASSCDRCHNIKRATTDKKWR